QFRALTAPRFSFGRVAPSPPGLMTGGDSTSPWAAWLSGDVLSESCGFWPRFWSASEIVVLFSKIMKAIRWRCLFKQGLLIGLFGLISSPLALEFLAGDWPQFRGPQGSGVSETTGLPVQFGPHENVMWKVSLPQGHSSPVIIGRKLLLT